MGLSAEKAARQHSESISDKFVVKTASCTLTVREQRVFVDSSGSATAVAIALPNVTEAKGLTFSIICPTGGYQGTITITASSTFDFAAPTIGEATDGCLLYSDGYTWWTLAVIT